MVLECLKCHKTFMYAAKKTTSSSPSIFERMQTTTSGTPEPVIVSEMLETHVCPHCGSLDIQERAEAKTK